MLSISVQWDVMEVFWRVVCLLKGLVALGNTKGMCGLLFSPQYCQVLMWYVATTRGNSLNIKPVRWIWDSRKSKNISDDGMVLTRSLNNKLSNYIICDRGCCHCLNHFNLYFLLHEDECVLFKYFSSVPNCFCAGMYRSHTRPCIFCLSL